MPPSRHSFCPSRCGSLAITSRDFLSVSGCRRSCRSGRLRCSCLVRAMSNLTLFVIGVLVTIPATIAIGGLVIVALREDMNAGAAAPQALTLDAGADEV